jgi:hypothetical protein
MDRCWLWMIFFFFTLRRRMWFNCDDNFDSTPFFWWCEKRFSVWNSISFETYSLYSVKRMQITRWIMLTPMNGAGCIATVLMQSRHHLLTFTCKIRATCARWTTSPFRCAFGWIGRNFLYQIWLLIDMVDSVYSVRIPCNDNYNKKTRVICTVIPSGKYL